LKTILKTTKKTSLAFGLLAIMIISLALLPHFAHSRTPEGPIRWEIINSTSKTTAPAATINAAAGNITSLNIFGKTVTQSWQGYVGNVSGAITLDDSHNNTIFNWTISSAKGEIYATYLPTVDWTAGRVYCWNWSGGGLPKDETLRLGELEGWDTTPGDVPLNTKTLGLSEPNAADSINNTFSPAGTLAHSNFYVGDQLINGSIESSCPLVKLYNSTGHGVFEQVLLFSNYTDFDNRGVIYTSILKSGVIGFDGNRWDFQMIVGVNGHNGNSEATPFYFYVELE
jgi:hypothetical protein